MDDLDVHAGPCSNVASKFSEYSFCRLVLKCSHFALYAFPDIRCDFLHNLRGNERNKKVLWVFATFRSRTPCKNPSIIVHNSIQFLCLASLLQLLPIFKSCQPSEHRASASDLEASLRHFLCREQLWHRCCLRLSEALRHLKQGMPKKNVFCWDSRAVWNFWQLRSQVTTCNHFHALRLRFPEFRARCSQSQFIGFTLFPMKPEKTLPETTPGCPHLDQRLLRPLLEGVLGHLGHLVHLGPAPGKWPPRNVWNAPMVRMVRMVWMVRTPAPPVRPFVRPVLLDIHSVGFVGFGLACAWALVWPQSEHCVLHVNFALILPLEVEKLLIVHVVSLPVSFHWDDFDFDLPETRNGWGFPRSSATLPSRWLPGVPWSDLSRGLLRLSLGATPRLSLGSFLSSQWYQHPLRQPGRPPWTQHVETKKHSKTSTLELIFGCHSTQLPELSVLSHSRPRPPLSNPQRLRQRESFCKRCSALRRHHRLDHPDYEGFLAGRICEVITSYMCDSCV